MGHYAFRDEYKVPENFKAKLYCSLLYFQIIIANQNQPKPAYTSGIKTSNWKIKYQPTTLHNYSRVIVQNNPDAGAQYVITQTERTVKVYPVYNGHSYGSREQGNNNVTFFISRTC